ncbi:MAG TPA: neutral zinc metallopeptidase [Pilimelia sp.]|nr:neutral zinc metallopeptidase [Pilimelia sp.]
MDLNENARVDTSQIDDRRGRGGGGGMGGLPIPIGGGRGGIIGLVAFVVIALLGGGGLGLNALNGDEAGGAAGPGLEQCAGDNPDLSRLDCRNALFVNSIQDYWQDALPQELGKPYRQGKTVYFSQSVNTGCGSANSGVGPFYCPPDGQVYIDLTFYSELANRFGAEGEFAQPYVLAHEYGHHVQNLLGTEAQMRRAQQRDPDNAPRYSVMLELQADCYAGVWAHHATNTTDAGGQRIFNSISDADIAQGIDAAGAVGDDAIQKKAGGQVNPAEFTHGSSADRQKWFKRGFDTGDPKLCDTFGNAL